MSDSCHHKGHEACNGVAVRVAKDKVCYRVYLGCGCMKVERFMSAGRPRARVGDSRKVYEAGLTMPGG
eukprot:1157767-Pelagomonas_calceolata.AAC.8